MSKVEITFISETKVDGYLEEDEQVRWGLSVGHLVDIRRDDTGVWVRYWEFAK